MRPVSFPADNFDIFDFASERVRAVLRASRERYADEHVLGKVKKSRLGDSDAASASSSAAAAIAPTAAITTAIAAPSSAAMDTEEDELAAAIRMSQSDAAHGATAVAAATSAPAPTTTQLQITTPAAPIGFGLPTDFRGLYELVAMVTHKGREADGGHYIGWRRAKGDTWLVFDDETVSETTTEFVMTELKGGGDQHMAYLLFYRAKC